MGGLSSFSISSLHSSQLRFWDLDGGMHPQWAHTHSCVSASQYISGEALSVHAHTHVYTAGEVESLPVHKR